MAVVSIEMALGHVFAQPGLLQQALTHRSFGSPHNERLEFLGDSVLNCVVAGLLFERFPEQREGDLSRLRANLVRQETLAQIALHLDLGTQLKLGEGEMKSGGFRRPSILADALEALFGAVFLDSGFAAAQGVIAAHYRDMIEAIDPNDAGKDPKTALQEWLQGRRHGLPVYALIDTCGEAHEQTFEVECRIEGLGIHCRGKGPSRRTAEQDAARCALMMIGSR